MHQSPREREAAKAEQIGRRYGSEEDKAFTERVAILSLRPAESWLFHALILSQGEVTLGNLVDEGFSINVVKCLQQSIQLDEAEETITQYVHKVKEYAGTAREMIVARMRLNLFELIESSGSQENIDMLELCLSILEGRPYSGKSNQRHIAGCLENERDRNPVGV